VKKGRKRDDEALETRMTASTATAVCRIRFACRCGREEGKRERGNPALRLVRAVPGSPEAGVEKEEREESERSAICRPISAAPWKYGGSRQRRKGACQSAGG